VAGFAWFAAAGERDMNYAELFQLDQELRKRDVRQRLRVFAGGHEWAPPSVWTEALEWFELLAMNDGLRPRDPALVASLFERASARAAAFQGRGEVLDEQRELGALVRDFDGSADTARARRRLNELMASPAYHKAIERERSLIDEQSRVTSDLQQDLARLGQAESEQHAEVVLRATRDANGLRRGLASAKEPGRRLVYERALAQVFIEAMESGRNALRQGHTDSALELFEIASALRPEAPAPLVARAQAQTLAGRRQEAVRALRRALELGLAPEELARVIESNDAFARLRGDPEIFALLKAPQQP
jgi:tetratricopeptide (TPR) repeat protein